MNTASSSPDSIMTLLCFELAQRLFAVDTTKVLAILGNQTITRLPHCPPHVQGAFGYRGRAVPLIDLRAFLKLNSEDEESAVENDSRTNERTIVIRALDMTAGFTVPFVRGIFDIPSPSAQPLRFCDEGRLPEFASVELIDKDEIIVVINMERVLSEARV